MTSPLPSQPEATPNSFWVSSRLGKSSINVVRLGVAASYGVSGKDVERAFERGLNFFYWGSTRTSEFGGALRRLGAQHRDKLKLVVQTYARWPSGIGKSLDKALKALNTDYADVLLLGWWNLPPRDSILDAAAEVVRLGKARSVMVSCHHRPTFQTLARDSRVDHLMIRYNAAHPGAENDVFPHLPEQRPGIVAYTSTSWGELLNSAYVPKGERVPTATDCYRFVLSNPNVNACWTGPQNGVELDEAIAALDRGPMTEEELAWMRRVGTAVKSHAGIQGKATNVADRFINLVSGFGFKKTSNL